ncbi:TPA: lipase chaperone [Burkholderia cenocepacia]|uniref:lipase secretion chaperone n=1 Tax=unclassified Burkholderia TaxID=2613784 RepID=UPI001588F4D4|nr:MULTISPECIES: lipase secretion chaperone [unclassified Burkholderia]HEF5871071.1 lipase chaperone [Burkholderia cenocepacia]
MKGGTMLLRAALYGATGTLAAAAVWHALGPPDVPTAIAGVAPVVDAAVPGEATVRPPAGAASEVALPAALAGSSAPRLPVGSDGHLAKRHAVREFFDYYLLAQHELAPAALDALVARALAAQPIGAAAQRDALDLWPRYRACVAAFDARPGAAPSGAGLDPDAIALALEQRVSLASRWLGDWSAPFFGDEFRQQRDDLERIRIARDPSLGEARKRERLAALDQSLPPGMRDARERLARQRDAIAAVARLDAQRATPDVLRVQLGADVAERVVQMQQRDDAWQARYRDYTAERERLDTQLLAPDAHDAQLAQLRQRIFPDRADALRAASLDAGSTSGPAAAH